MNIQKDLFGREPKVGDIIAFNPPSYKGLTYGTCVGFSKAGLPKINNVNDTSGISWDISRKGFYSPKTGFVIVKDI